jgi:hypothetical protein
MKCCEYDPRGHIHNTSFSSKFKNEPNKLVLHYAMLERFTTRKHSSLMDPFVSYEENEVLWIQPHGPYSQNFIFFET